MILFTFFILNFVTLIAKEYFAWTGIHTTFIVMKVVI